MNHEWYEEEDYDEEEAARAQRKNMRIGKITIEGNESLGIDIAETVARKYYSHADAKIREAIDKAINSAISKRVDEALKGRVEQSVEEAIKDGWPSTDSYGNVKGTVSMRRRIGMRIDKMHGGDRDRAIDKVVTEFLATEFKTELDRLKGKLREKLEAKFDETVQGQIVGVLRNAFGLGIN